MGSSIFGIAVTGLNAANLGLTTTGHNIANVNTEGYSRQITKQSAPYPQGSGSGFVGLGVQVDTIVRAYDEFATRQLQSAQSKSSFYDSYLSHLTEIDNIVADRNAGVSPALQQFFSAVQNVATNPSNIPSRQALLSAAQTLVNRFQSFDQRLTEQRDALNGEITNSISNINAIAKQIADINNQIVISKSSGQPPNDLLDKRDQMVLEINKLVKAGTTEQADGSINVFIGSGQNLVAGGAYSPLAALISPSDNRRITVGYSQSGGTVFLPEELLSGGQLGALLEFRTKSLDVAQNGLAQVAVGVAEMLNRQQAAGMDLYGSAGKSLFTYNTTTAGAATPPALGGAQAFSTNGGTGALTGYIQDISQLTNSNYELSYDGANYTLTKQTDRSVTSITAADMAAGYVVPNTGLYLQMAGAPQTNDRFTIKPYTGFVNSLGLRMTDPREVAAAAPIRLTTTTSNTGTGKATQPNVDAPSTVTTQAAADVNLLHRVTMQYVSGTNSLVVTDTVNAATVTLPYTAGMTVSFNGWNLKVDGAPANNDSFVVDLNTNGTEDGRNALQMSALQTKRQMMSGTATYQDSYGQMVATIGTQTNEASIMSKAQGAMLTQAENARNSTSGVNLDEEAANLLRYQQAYIAASKVIQIAQKAFDEIVNIGR